MTNAWKPERAVQIVAGTPPGGGLDRVARALAGSINEAKLLDVPVEVLNVPGDGARRAWTHYVNNYPGDAHVISISSPNLTSDYLVGIANFEHTLYSPIATLVTEYIAFGVRTDSSFKDGADLLAALGRDPSSVRVALSTALGNPNHVALARLTRHAGGDVNGPVVRVFDTALDAVGRIRLVGISAHERLAGALPVRRPGGAWRGLRRRRLARRHRPRGPQSRASRVLGNALRAAVISPVWQSELSKMSWTPAFQFGAALKSYLQAEREGLISILDELTLLRIAPTL